MYFKKRPTALQCWKQPPVSDGTALYRFPPPSQDIWTAPHPHLFSFTTVNVSLAPPTHPKASAEAAGGTNTGASPCPSQA